MRFIKYLLPIIFIFLITIFIIDKKYLQAYDYQTLKIQRENFALNAKEDDPIVIGVVWSFEEAKKVGDNFKEGVEFAIEELNSNGGVLNREIESIFEEDYMDVDTAVNIAKNFSLNEEVIAVVGYAFSDLAIQSSIVYDYSGIVMISPGSSDPLFTRDDFNYIFRTVPNDIEIGKAMTKMCKLKNFQKVAVLYEKNNYATILANVFIENALELGTKVVYKANFNENEKFFTEIITNLSPITNYNIDYDAIVVIGYDKSVPLLIKKARDKGVSAPFLTSDMLDLKKVLTMGGFFNNTIITTIFNSETLNLKTQNFLEKFKKRYNFYPDTWAAQGYDAIMLLAEAIKRSNSTNPASISENLKYIKNFESIFGKYSMTPKGDVEGKGVYFKIIKDGKFKYLNLN